MNYWLVKTEPETYSYEDLVSNKEDVWDGVRNYQARNFLKEMKIGESVLVYHSGKDKAVMGIAKISQEAFPDPSDKENKGWVAVKLQPVAHLKKPVTLDQIKEEASLSEVYLIKQGRLSVMPLEKVHFEMIRKISEV